MKISKRIRRFAAAMAAMLVLTLPMSALAADGDMLLKVDYTSKKFETINKTDDQELKFTDRFDVVIKKDYIKFEEKADDPAAGCHLWYVYGTDYEITADTKYTYYFEAATPTAGKYDGIAIATNGEDHWMMYGSFSMNGDSGANDFRWRMNHKDAAGTEGGWVDQTTVICDTVEDADGYLFTTCKIELDGLEGKCYWLDKDGKWQEVASSFTLPEGLKLAVGVYGRDGNRPLIVKNTKIIEGIGLEIDEIPTTADATTTAATTLLVVGFMAAAAYVVLEKKYRMN